MRFGGSSFLIRAKEFNGFSNGHVQYVADAFSFIFYIEHFVAVTLTTTTVAGKINIGHKLHFNLYHTFAFAFFAASAFDIE